MMSFFCNFNTRFPDCLANRICIGHWGTHPWVAPGGRASARIHYPAGRLPRTCEDLRESLFECAREQILEDFRVERPWSVSVSAWQKQQGRQIDRAIARIQLCEIVDELVNHAYTVLKHWNLEAFPYLHVSQRAEEQLLSAGDFQFELEESGWAWLTYAAPLASQICHNLFE
ncbi:hypothetical protein AK812_SmicGene20557 [Symbiodinium microadriaticum]|uniref:Uncharacterized protein n=1 Tax=Symbiodinium microadriaticum TaxID=2951 RepID=A0A1Q9DPP0_SYMMI|nr:hypothetical protein AK812_SmicGene20557 [Symbiodinium microadriaticum]